MTATTTFASLRAAGGGSLGVANGQTCAYAGKRGDGSTFSSIFTIADASTATVGDLVSQIQARLRYPPGQSVSATARSSSRTTRPGISPST